MILQIQIIQQMGVSKKYRIIRGVGEGYSFDKKNLENKCKDLIYNQFLFVLMFVGRGYNKISSASKFGGKINCSISFALMY